MSEWDKVMAEFEVEKISEEYIKASNILPFSASDIQSVFSEEELEEVAKFVGEMKHAADDNNAKYELITHYRKVAVGLIQLAKIVV